MTAPPEAPAWLSSSPARWLVSAPGRVNLIGEHVDYCDGFVLPAALGLRTWMAASPRTDAVLSIETEEGLRTEFASNAAPPAGPDKWANYLRGVLFGCLAAGLEVPGLEVRIASTIPQGAGLASSAALTVAFALLLEQAAGRDLDKNQKAKICQDAEAFAGVPSGCMDQMSAVHARDGHAMLLDCRSGAIDHIPLGNAGLVIVNTGVKHDLADGGYAARHAETREAARLLGVPSLRDVNPDRLTELREKLPPVLFLRARHVVTEIQRTLECADALRNRDLALAGRLMNASHDSLRDDFEVSCAELDLVVRHALTIPGVFGCRLTGGGFGGCCVALVDHAAVPETIASLTDLCRTKLPPGAAVIATRSDDTAAHPVNGAD